MISYLDTIQEAIVFFPIIVLLITIPYLYYEYKKNGKIELSKSIKSYSFLLYIICCYALVILPLPSYEEVLNSQGPYTDLRFLGFIDDLFYYTNFSMNPATWYATIKSVWFYIPFFNFIMLIPFGIYERRLFNNSFIKSTFYAFLLSLSFELIQLSGLLGLYPHPYRLFQVDDLFLNTLGAVFGWLIVPKKSKKAENIRSHKFMYGPNFRLRTVIFVLDLLVLSIIMQFVSRIFGQNPMSEVFINNYFIYLISALFYYCFVAWFLDQRTLSGYLLNQKYTTRKGHKVKPALFIIRQVLVFGFILPSPFFGYELINSGMLKIITIPVGLLLILLPFIIIIQVYLGNIPFYEAYTQVFLSDTRKLKRTQRANRDQPTS